MRIKKYLACLECCGVQLIDFEFESNHRVNSKANLIKCLNLFEKKHGGFLKNCITTVLYIEEINY